MHGGRAPIGWLTRLSARQLKAGSRPTVYCPFCRVALIACIGFESSATQRGGPRSTSKCFPRPRDEPPLLRSQQTFEGRRRLSAQGRLRPTASAAGVTGHEASFARFVDRTFRRRISSVIGHSIRKLNVAIGYQWAERWRPERSQGYSRRRSTDLAWPLMLLVKDARAAPRRAADGTIRSRDVQE